MQSTYTRSSRAGPAFGVFFAMTACLLAPADEVGAQTPRFRLTPLVRLGFVPITDITGAIAINNKGQVVYGYQPEEDDVHAWLWLPECDYGLAAGFHDLHDLDEFPEPSIARDINESGIIVGQADGYFAGNGAGNGAVWECKGDGCEEGEVIYTALGKFDADEDADEWSGAWAINDESPPVIVGVSKIDRSCACSLSTPEDVNRPFRLVFDSPFTLVELSPPSPDKLGAANDINTPEGENDLLIAGWTDCDAGDGLDDAGEGLILCETPDPCRETLSAVLWEPSSPNILEEYSAFGERARDLNNNEEIVGWGQEEGDPCVQRALYWSSPTSMSVIDLGLTSELATRAEAINNLDPPQVVGWISDGSIAVLWEDPDSTPIMTDLNGVIGNCDSRWELKEAHDINDNGWVVVQADDIYGTTGLYAVLLTPFPECPVDINQSGCVNEDDEDAVLNTWGDCGVAVICSADVDGNCTVDADDYIAVILGWGCPSCSSSFGSGDPPTLGEMIESVLASPLTQGEQADLIAILIAVFG